MKLSKSFWQTYKEVPADAEVPSHQLMMRAGLIQKSAAGIYNYLPFLVRVIRKVETIVREEMDKISQEVTMSVVTPGELWQESGRWDAMGSEMLKFKDKRDRDLCISPTNEEAITDIFRGVVKSYKNLPTSLYQVNTKFRDEIRPRFGLMRGREFIMKDAYTFHADKECMDRAYQEFYDAYCTVFERLGFEYTVVEADGGAMAGPGSQTHEFQVVADTGEDEIIYCAETGYAANSEKAQTKRKDVDFESNDTTLEEVPTPNMATIEDVCHFLKKPQTHSLKSLVYTGIKGEDEEIVLIQLLGDDTLNEVKLKNYLQVDHLNATPDTKLKELGLPVGFIGPHGLKNKMRILVDSAVNPDAAYVAGALKVDVHYKGLVPNRDIDEFETVDLRLSREGDLTWDEKGTVSIRRGIEVGHIFQLGDKYTTSMEGATVLDQNGKTMAPLMGCYGLGITRTIAAAIEQNHDDKGIIWPVNVAPYHVYFAAICKSDEYKQKADELYDELVKAGVEVVYDDRKAGPGFKFKDADLLGLPIRLVFGERDFKESGELELVIRKTGEKKTCKPEEMVALIEKTLAELS